MDARVVEGCPVGTTHVGWSAMLCLVHLVLHRCGGRVCDVQGYGVYGKVYDVGGGWCVWEGV